MANPPNPSTQAHAPARDHAANTNDVTALLLEVLRNVNREVETTTRELEGDAQKAVVHFCEISRDLRTPADEGAIFGTSTAATTGSTGTTGTSGSTGTVAPPGQSR